MDYVGNTNTNTICNSNLYTACIIDICLRNICLIDF